MLSREGKWTEKQRKFRRDCREEEKEVERMINFMEMNVESIKRAKAAREAQEATPVANDPDAPKEGASTDPLGLLAGEFVSGTAASMDCCTEPRCPCHE